MKKMSHWVAVLAMVAMATSSTFGQAAIGAGPSAALYASHSHRPGMRAARHSAGPKRRVLHPRSHRVAKTNLEKAVRAKKKKVVAAGLGAAAVGAGGLAFATRNSHPHVSTAAACVGFACAVASRALAGSADYSELKMKKKALREQ